MIILNSMEPILIWIIILNDLFVLCDFLYISRRRGLAPGYNYNSINIFSNLLQRTFYQYRFLFGYIIFFKFLALSHNYPWIYDKLPKVIIWENNILSWILFLLFLDFFYYVWHYASHRYKMFWFFHQVHHQDSNLNSLTAYRIGLGENVSIVPFVIMFAFIGVPAEYFFFSLQIHSRLMGWLHSSIPRLPRIFEFFLNTASHHRRHHSLEPKYMRANCGGLLIIFDRIFGTCKEDRDMPTTFGVMGHTERISPIKDVFYGVFEKVKGFYPSKRVEIDDLDWHILLWMAFTSSTTFIWDLKNSLSFVGLTILAMIILEFNFFPRNNKTLTWIFRIFCSCILANMLNHMFNAPIVWKPLKVLALLTNTMLLGILYLQIYFEKSREREVVVNIPIEAS